MDAEHLQIIISVTTTVIAVMGLLISLYQFLKSKAENAKHRQY